MATDTKNPNHLDRWLMRYGITDAYPRWRAADATQAPGLAFTAVACDSHILMRLNRATASKIARQAEQMISEIDAVGNATEAARAAAQAVASRVRNWRLYIASCNTDSGPEIPEGHGHDTAAVITRPTSIEEIFSVALHEFPQSRAAVAKSLFDVTLSMRTAGLLKLGAPMDVVLSLGAARLAARSVRGHSSSPRQPREKSVEAVGIVQEWGRLADKNPFIMSYDGWVGSLPHKALSLAVDASTCALIAIDLPGGSGAAGFNIWEAAEEFHAYSVLGLDASLLDNMDFDKAQSFASAAARFATAVIADPGVKLPNFPKTCDVLGPKIILAIARSALSDGIRPRRSGSTVSD